MYFYKVPLRDVVDLQSRGCRKLNRGNTGVRSYWAYVRFAACCTVAVGMSVYCTSAFENQRDCRLQSSSLCLGWYTKTHIHANVQKYRSWLPQGNTLKCGCCCTLAVTTYRAWRTRGYIYSSKQSRKNNDAEIEPRSVFCVPTGCRKILG